MAERAPNAGLAQQDIDALVAARHTDPFALLGPHMIDGAPYVRAWLPNAASVQVVARDRAHVIGELTRIHPAGLFAGPLAEVVPYRLDIDWQGVTQEVEDPYSFGPQLSEDALRRLANGDPYAVLECLGAQPLVCDGVPGTRFAVWAPNARRVSVVGDFNAWDGRRHPMRLRHEAGVWELFIPRVAAGARYKYEILGARGDVLPLKSDPCALQTESPPATASIVAPVEALDHFAWHDREWLRTRSEKQSARSAIAVYEVHAPSWLPTQGEDAPAPNWSALADRLIPYAQGMGFTHIELMPVAEHPFGGSWGYQPLAQFAPTARLGSPLDFAAFIDRAHEAGLGVILDWVPAHFPNDAHGLIDFDGTALYEHSDPREGYHPDWNTMIYNLGRREVSAFLIASALAWLLRYHIDALRVDAVASMLYRDYSRGAGEWVPNVYGGRENLEAIAFLKRLNHETQYVPQRPGVITIAEESTAWPGVTARPEDGGLGFQFKWNMGWMHDTLHYMHEDPIHRRYHHHEMTFALVYAWSEHFVLPLSHDEVVHGKGSLIGKMPGDRWQRFANLRAYFGFMWAHPGKKLLFMGGEFAQWAEFDHDGTPQWALLDDPLHRGVQKLVRDLNRLYGAEPALYALDAEPGGFEWLVGDDRDNSVLAWRRVDGAGREIVAVCNFTPVPRHGYRIGMPQPGQWEEVLNTDAAWYGGSNMGNGGVVWTQPVASHGKPQSAALVLPPLGTLYFRLVR
ncbi:MAG: 1,4-alpha-glucan branching protein GlgB [Paraburkholderia sp.]|uniref:1,4-alpha-glucan branching protein GlgB n=1 Tax=Paraburkholderia sp. TaxID=1926495 RepID=UPI001203DA7A|nr:1,4-alpha-glucan branching protein GlgB [Paraburkholderia sp.]TAL99662.1 MAG: 1,4-alpha-glucan branching protein GlgB [Paraburkholderia sp.]TAM29129.1 MAG: 1,4-alpha-glucan branching protein GlgB [Paraburkholderia sp.]